MQQRVHFLTYLVKNHIDFASPQEDAVLFIPENSEVTHISFVVDEPSEAGVSLSIGQRDDTQSIANGIDCTQVGTNIINKVWQSKGEEIKLTLAGDATQGSGTLRVGYYLPSTTILEC